MIRNDVKPALMAAIEGEFAKNPKNTEFMPIRTSRADVAKKAGAGKQAGVLQGLLCLLRLDKWRQCALRSKQMLCKCLLDGFICALFHNCFYQIAICLRVIFL